MRRRASAPPRLQQRSLRRERLADTPLVRLPRRHHLASHPPVRSRGLGASTRRCGIGRIDPPFSSAPAPSSPRSSPACAPPLRLARPLAAAGSATSSRRSPPHLCRHHLAHRPPVHRRCVWRARSPLLDRPRWLPFSSAPAPWSPRSSSAWRACRSAAWISISALTATQAATQLVSRTPLYHIPELNSGYSTS